jgi:checkpoint serine/threonine-protein kinase
VSPEHLSSTALQNSIRISHKDADDIYRQGIKRSARPLERLKKRYKEFQDRPSSSSARSTTTDSHPKGPSQTDILRHDPLKNHSSSQQLPLNSRNAFSHMHAPLAPGRRPEKLRFNLSLLYTQDGGEYSYQESRARSMGLLSRTWGPPPEEEVSISVSASSSSSSIQMDVNDDDQKTVMNPRRKSMGMRGEPTVTINTKEALADVFGMYNSPDKTLKVQRPGSKHAPVKKFEPATPAAVLRQSPKELVGDENTPAVKTPGEQPRGVLFGLY